MCAYCGLTKKAEPPPTRDVRAPATSRPTESGNGGWLRRLVRRHGHKSLIITPLQADQRRLPVEK